MATTAHQQKEEEEEVAVEADPETKEPAATLAGEKEGDVVVQVVPSLLETTTTAPEKTDPVVVTL